MENIENRPVAIKVSGVKKMYKLGQICGGTLQADLQSWWAKVRGKEDPNSKIGEGERSHGKTFMALNGIDLTIYQGEAVGIIGSNGAGKSTLLKLLSKVTAPTEGEIDIYGRIASMLEVGTGFNGEMTGRENVYMNGAILGMTKQEIDAKMEEIIEFSEVREFIDTPVKRYSSGMFVKLAFSVAAHLDSEIMIMDEVLAVGDMAFQKKCLTKMREAAKQDGRTVLYVSHNMNTIRQLCDRCIVLDKGKVIFEGSIEEAIGIYMGKRATGEYPVFYHLKEMKRYPQFGNKIRLNTLRFVEKTSPTYEVGEKILLEICVFSSIQINNVQLCFPIKTGELTKVGMVMSKPFNLSMNKNTRAIVCLDTNELGNDLYCLDIGILKKDPVGNFLMYDTPSVNIFLQLVNESSRDLVWHKEYWGNVRFEDIDVLSVESL